MVCRVPFVQRILYERNASAQPRGLVRASSTSSPDRFSLSRQPSTTHSSSSAQSLLQASCLPPAAPACGGRFSRSTSLAHPLSAAEAAAASRSRSSRMSVSSMTSRCPPPPCPPSPQPSCAYRTSQKSSAWLRWTDVSDALILKSSCHMSSSGVVCLCTIYQTYRNRQDTATHYASVCPITTVLLYLVTCAPLCDLMLLPWCKHNVAWDCPLYYNSIWVCSSLKPKGHSPEDALLELRELGPLGIPPCSPLEPGSDPFAQALVAQAFTDVPVVAVGKPCSGLTVRGALNACPGAAAASQLVQITHILYRVDTCL